jgi:hypothetical protein
MGLARFCVAKALTAPGLPERPMIFKGDCANSTLTPNGTLVQWQRRVSAF